MNKVILIGRLTKDPEVRYGGQSQMAICTFTLALDRGKDKDGNNRGADFPKVNVFGKMAENCERFLKKGRLVAIEGHIHTGSFEDKNGNKIYTTDVAADRVEFLEWDKKPTATEETSSDPAPSGFTQIQEDIPF